MNWRRLALGLPLVGLLGLAAFWGQRPVSELRDTHLIFGTMVEIVIRDRDVKRARAASRAAGQLLQELHRDWHAWEPGALTEVNAGLKAGRRVTVSPLLAETLRAGKQLACESGGTFDPAIGQLIALWGFHADGQPAGPRPSERDLDALRIVAPSMADLTIEQTWVSSRNRSVQIDLGGYGKGAALDAVATLLQHHGIQNAVLNAGGDVNVLGSFGHRPWRVAIRDPFVWGIVASVEMQPGEVLYTSGNYERYFEEGGIRFAHIIDPRTGAPVQKIVSVSVLHENGARADAAATALSVAGPEAWAQVAADMGITQAMLITDDGRVLASPKMASRLEFESASFAQDLQVVPLPPAHVHAECTLEDAQRRLAQKD